MLALRLKLAALLNRFRRRKGPAFRDQCVSVIMRVCALQLRRGSTRELAPARGMFGACTISGGAITKLSYRVFDKHVDLIDPTIRADSCRAFLSVTVRIYLDHDPEWEVEMQLKDGETVAIDAKDVHKTPGIELIQHLAAYFPLLPDAYAGAVYKPPTEADQ